MGNSHEDLVDALEFGAKPQKVNGCTCCHVCDLAHGCCICSFRTPRPGLFPVLTAWWHKHGIAHGQSTHGTFRFYCASCRKRVPTEVACLALPFGGCLVDSPQDACYEQVEPQMALDASSDASWEDVGLDVTSQDGRWVV